MSRVTDLTVVIGWVVAASRASVAERHAARRLRQLRVGEAPEVEGARRKRLRLRLLTALSFHPRKLRSRFLFVRMSLRS